jgi:hypothetical protein
MCIEAFIPILQPRAPIRQRFYCACWKIYSAQGLVHVGHQISRALRLPMPPKTYLTGKFIHLAVHHFMKPLQLVPSEDLEPETLESNPRKYHDAWRSLVGAQ